MRNLSKPFLLLGMILVICCFIACSSDNHNFDVNNEKYRYLFEEDYGENFITIIHNTDELSQHNLNAASDLTKYDEAYFLNNYLLIFNFQIQYSESKLKVEATKFIDDNQLLMNISINSPANYESTGFDAQISLTSLFVDIPKENIKNIDDLKVGILVINNRFKNVYCSIYYDCRRMEEK